MPLPNGRRADMMAIDAKGALTIVEIKVAKADLLGDAKWTDYLDYCDRFFWAVPPDACGDLRGGALPARRGRPDRRRSLRRGDRARARRTGRSRPARRKAELLRFARRAARRLSAQIDPTLGRQLSILG